MEKKEIGNGWRTTGITLAIASLIPLVTGFYKLFAYENGESYPYDMVNAYVGGDAYNYIINANYATAYFVLAGILLLGALGCGVLMHLAKLTFVEQIEQETEETNEPNQEVVIEDK